MGQLCGLLYTHQRLNMFNHTPSQRRLKSPAVVRNCERRVGRGPKRARQWENA